MCALYGQFESHEYRGKKSLAQLCPYNKRAFGRFGRRTRGIWLVGCGVVGVCGLVASRSCLNCRDERRVGLTGRWTRGLGDWKGGLARWEDDDGGRRPRHELLKRG